MSREYVETGQTLTSDGDAYCPVERRRRGLLGLAASLAVLVAGTAFLGFAMFSKPIPATEVARDDAVLELQGPVIIKIDPSPSAASMSVEEALAESRAARASVAAAPSMRTIADGPSVKPARTITPAEEQTRIGFAPRIKPAAEQVETVTAYAPRAMRLGEAMLASVDDAPPSFFFASDIERNVEHVAAAAVLYAGDLATQDAELKIRVAKGETFVDALARAGVGAADRNAAAYAFGRHYNLRRLRPGQVFHLTLGRPNQTIYQIASNGEADDVRLLNLEFRADHETRVFVRRDASGNFVGEKESVALTTRVLSFMGRIDGSLYLSAKAAGAPDQIIADLADAFSYDVDFQREIMGGDEFEAIFEAKYDDEGELVSTGDIIYARLNWRGRSKEKGYYRFDENDDGRSNYFDATGQSARRLLMKTPIDGARLSSGFGRRKHPILGYRRAHKGVDFAAARGTPIKAAGDGVVERADRYGSFGNYIRIRHANGYKTAYAHLKGFRRGVRKGKRVSQGDIIGYVGTTGRSTGPHLHYEVHLRGAAVNQMRLKIAATGKKLTGGALDRFQIERGLIDAMRLPKEARAPLYAKDNASESAL